MNSTNHYKKHYTRNKKQIKFEGSSLTLYFEVFCSGVHVVSVLLGCDAASLVFGCRRSETTTLCRNVGNQISNDATSRQRRTDASSTVPLGMFCLLTIRRLGLKAKLQLGLYKTKVNCFISPYRTVTTLHHGYKNEPVNDV
jgi:hypothetical protein